MSGRREVHGGLNGLQRTGSGYLILMQHLVTILAQHPRVTDDHGLIARALSSVAECALVCSVCADACADELGDDLGTCIRYDIDCAAICRTTAELLTRHPVVDPGILVRQLHTCSEMCRRSAMECESHAERHAHCATCAAVCHHCADACEQLADALRATVEM